MSRATSGFDLALRLGDDCRLVAADGSALPLGLLPVPRWLAATGAADEALLDRCTGPTLDVGCGPGRLVAGLARRGVVGLGVDVSPAAVALTRARGVSALRRDVFSAIPGEGRWHHVVLADGNLGIGGDPVRLLRRCAELLRPGGSVVLDLAPPGTGVRVHQVRVAARGRLSDAFAWAWIGVDAAARVAADAGLALVDRWRTHDRWQAVLAIPEVDDAAA